MSSGLGATGVRGAWRTGRLGVGLLGLSLAVAGPLSSLAPSAPDGPASREVTCEASALACHGSIDEVERDAARSALAARHTGEITGIRFEDRTEQAGVAYRGASFGASWGDLDGDGRPDLWVGNHLDAPDLFVNQGDGTFVDFISPATFLADELADKHGAAWADFDGDGDRDLIVVTGAENGLGSNPNLLLVNESGVLVDRAVELHADNPLGRARTPLWLDQDLDGRLDLFLSNAKRADDLDAPPLLLRQTVEGFEDRTAALGIDVDRAFYAQLARLSGSASPDLFVHFARYPRAVYTTGESPVHEVSDEVGLGSRIDDVYDSAFEDFDGDLDTDLFLLRCPEPTVASDVALDGERLAARLRVSQSEREVRFRTAGTLTISIYGPLDLRVGVIGQAAATRLGLTLSPQDTSTWGVAAHAAGQDAGLYIGYAPQTQTWRLVHSNPATATISAVVTSTEPISDVEGVGFDPEANFAGARLLLDQGGVLVDATTGSGLEAPTSCQSAVAGDFDNDMDVDLYLVCSRPVANLPNLLLENQGDGTFVAVENAGGAAGSADGRGDVAVVADYDGDGALDLFVTNGQYNAPFNNGPSQLFHNVGNDNHWVEIDLEGVLSNREGIGARVLVTAGGITQRRDQMGGMHRYAQNHTRLHFGLGPHDRLERIEVRWPSGITQVVEDLAADQILHLTESTLAGLVGRPPYVPGQDSGVFLWLDEPGGTYRLRASGDAQGPRFTIRLVSSEPLTAVIPRGLEPSDVLHVTTSGFYLESRSWNGEDGVDFDAAPGSRVLLAVEQDGVAAPQQIRAGPAGAPLEPAGWVRGPDDFPIRPPYSAGHDVGLFVGRRSAGGTIEARWSNDGPLRFTEFTLIGSSALGTIGLVSIEPADEVVESASSIRISGRLLVGADGVNVGVAGIESVGLAYRQDGLFRPDLVNPNGSALGVPNAYRLPIDSDGDLLDDVEDNCVGRANADQRDTDGDGYGNACDADLDGDGLVGLGDLALFETALASGDAEHADFDGDGVVDSADRARLELALFGPPGPSGVPVSIVPVTSQATGIAFSDVSEAAGVSRVVTTVGASWGEFNGDRCPDLWVGNHYERPSLYVNGCDGAFEDVSTTVVPWSAPGDDGHGAAWGDLDNDGDQDLVEVSADYHNRVYLRSGGALHDVAEAWGIGGCALADTTCDWTRTMTPLLLDADRDGRLDVVLSRTVGAGSPPSRLHRQTGSGFEDASAALGFDVHASSYFSMLADLTGDAEPELLVDTDPYPGAVYDTAVRPFVPLAFSPGTSSVEDAAAGDLDGDLDVDLLLVRGEDDSDLYRPDPDVLQLRLSTHGSEHGARFRANGPLTIEIDRVTRPADVYVGAGGFHPGARTFTLEPDDAQVEGLPAAPTGEDKYLRIGFEPSTSEWTVLRYSASASASVIKVDGDEPFADAAALGFAPAGGGPGSRLLRGTPGGFVDATGPAGLSHLVNGRSVALADFDNDMDLDAFVVAGRPAGHAFNLLYANQGDGTFLPVPGSGGAVGSQAGSGDTVVAADYDLDGFVDLFLTHSVFLPSGVIGPHQLLRNRGNANHWLELDLEGVVANRDGIGASVWVTAGGVTQLRERSGGMHRYAQNHARLHFGLGGHERIERIEVRWPSGATQVVQDVPADQLLHVIEPSLANPVGRPDYVAGATSGVFVWQDGPGGPYRLRASGDEAGPRFVVRLVSSEPLVAVTPVSLEGGDRLRVSPAGFRLDSRSWAGEDGVDFEVAPGARVLVSVEQNGVANPRQVHVGAAGVPLAPAGWIRSPLEFPARPGFAPGADVGLFVGRKAAGTKIEARVSGDGPPRRTELVLLGSSPFGTVGLVDIEPADAVTQTASMVAISSETGAAWDGVNLGVTQVDDVGLVFRQDDLVQPHRVNPHGPSLPPPNAYLLP